MSTREMPRGTRVFVPVTVREDWGDEVEVMAECGAGLKTRFWVKRADLQPVTNSQEPAPIVG